MSCKGDCWDNAVAESFFHTLKVARRLEYLLQRSREGVESREETLIFNYPPVSN